MPLLLDYEVLDVLKKDYNISYNSIKDIEINDNEMVVKTPHGDVYIYDSDLIMKVKASRDREFLEKYYPKDELLKELFSLGFKYENIRIPFSYFKKIYERYPKVELIDDFEKIETKYIIKRSVTPEDVTRELWEGLLEYVIKNNKTDHTIGGTEKTKIPYNMKEVIDLIAKSTDTDKVDIFYKL